MEIAEGRYRNGYRLGVAIDIEIHRNCCEAFIKKIVAKYKESVAKQI